MPLEHDRRHLTLPVIGTVRAQERSRRIERLCSLGRAKVGSITLSRRRDRLIAAVKVAVARPQQPGGTKPRSVVGVDVGVRRLATVATSEEVTAELESPKALGRRLAGPERPPRCTSAPAGALGGSARGAPATASLRTPPVREHLGRGRPVLPLVEDVPLLWPRPRHRLARALGLRRLGRRAPA